MTMTEKLIVEMARTERKKYAREWRAANKDKTREIAQRYWLKRAQKTLEENANA